jgi:hypothetical protein
MAVAATVGAAGAGAVNIVDDARAAEAWGTRAAVNARVSTTFDRHQKPETR